MLSDEVLWERFKEDSLSLEEGHRESIYDAMRWAYDRACEQLALRFEEEMRGSDGGYVDGLAHAAHIARSEKHQQEDA